ncbi:efflux transporter periplasmic adaptor subunit [Alcanivorax sp. HI0044]|uniref:efflux RND transporter periplasmic adaptor subunit n=3 Tax=Alcanivorax TaxID=59753 RepID=UPI0007B96924|nr:MULTISPECIES: efflux RND transporter periplasmic adaptor subunit [unclassified Alcanivorax]KZY40071.1 efflux transporter periplasmic adaptor subunit [Alcanivorax sp. HI0044]PHR66741.1 MAG: efflux RND transporter periplasmic adaptor subunit [Alcanivorax sp.]
MSRWIRRYPKAALLFVILMVSLLLAGWRWGFTSAPVTQWQTATVERGDVEELVTALGTLEPGDYVDVGAQVSGQLTRLHVDVGDSVEQGQLLAEIDASVQQTQVDAGLAELEALRAQLEQREAELNLAELQFQRQQRLRAANATSDDAFQSARSTRVITRAQIKVLKAQIRQKQASVEGDQANLGYAKIYAPRSGTVVSLEAREGQTLNANQTTPTLMRIADLSTMTVSTQVSEADVDRLAAGMPVYFNTLGNGQVRYDSTLRQVLPTPEVVNNVVLYTAEFDIANPQGKLMSGMTAQVFFVVNSEKDVLNLPVAAVKRNDRGQWQVQVPGSDGQPQNKTVKAGINNRVRTVILEGLNEGDTVLLGQAARQAAGASKDRPRRGGLF